MRPRAAGFTLIELLVVLAIIAITVATVSLAIRDPAASQLEQEGARLAALLEGARAEARASGLAVRWVPNGADAATPGFRFVGLPPAVEMPDRWLDAGVVAQVDGATALVLGPEPLIGAQRVVLRLGDRSLALATDGLGPFDVAPDASPAGRP